MIKESKIMIGQKFSILPTSEDSGGESAITRKGISDTLILKLMSATEQECSFP